MIRTLIEVQLNKFVSLIRIYVSKIWNFMKSSIILNSLLRGETNVILKVKMFSMEEKKFIVREFAKNPSPEKVRRAFISHFHIRGRATQAYKRNMFSRVRDNFEKFGSVCPRKPLKKKTKRTQEAIQEVKDFIEENPRCSLRKAEQQISPSKTTLWRILRYDLNFKFYHYKMVQSLSDVHKEQRKKYCEWLLEQPNNFVDRVVWTDEKFFCLNQKPHRKNDGTWCDENPRKICETNNRNDLKVMIFVAVVKGKIPIVHAFLDDGGHLISVTGSSYLSLLQETVWPKLRFSATRSNLWWMQDGAPPHCTNEVLNFLQDKFHGRVISRRTEHPWPAHSPDLNPLDFHFWSAAQKKVFAEKPSSINSLVQCVKDFAEDYSEETVKNVCKNVLKRARLCIQAGGGHFQQLM